MTRLWSDASDDDPKKPVGELARRVEQGETARTLEAAGVGKGGMRLHSGGGIRVEDGGGIDAVGGGNIVVNDGGDIEVRDGGDIYLRGGTLQAIDPNGVVVAYFGPTAFGDDTSSGLRFRYDNDKTAFLIGGTPGSQAFALYDRAGSYIVTNDAVTGVGLARPYLNIPMVPSQGTSVGTGGPFWPEFVNASFQEVMYRITTLWHPRITVGVNTSTTSGDVEWELRIDGVTAGSGTNDGAGTFDIPGWGSTILPGNQRSVQLWARNTLGTASRLIVDNCYGTQS
jgi:hypothetical protein